MAHTSKIPIRMYTAVLLGIFFEYFDYAIYGFMAAYLSRQFFPFAGAKAATTWVWLAFSVSFLVRPFASVGFGHFADRYGRRRVLLATTALMSLSTFGIGLLPSYQAIGFWAPAGLIFCRLIQGIAVSTEYSGGSTYILEFSPKRPGLASGVITSASSFGIFAASGLTWLFHSNWRFPFLLSGALVGTVGLYMRHSLLESPDFIKLNQSSQSIAAWPSLQLLKTSKRALAFCLMISLYAATSICVLMMYLPSFLSTKLNIPQDTALGLSTFLSWSEACAAIALGAISDVFGIQKTVVYGAVLFFVSIVPVFFLFHLPYMFFWFTAATILAFCIGSVDGPLMAWMVQLFPTHTRYTGLGFCYNIGIFIGGGLSPAVLSFLQNQFPQWDIIPFYCMAFIGLFLLGYAFLSKPHTTHPLA